MNEYNIIILTLIVILKSEIKLFFSKLITRLLNRQKKLNFKLDELDEILLYEYSNNNNIQLNIYITFSSIYNHHQYVKCIFSNTNKKVDKEIGLKTLLTFNKDKFVYTLPKDKNTNNRFIIITDFKDCNLEYIEKILSEYYF